ncbi:LacI family DNA-binding transcriptional regulator [Oryzicola mucosus]|uniref:LacI family DNA-binding transcriptional regulator n=1 Tax=Oryzicola mucosus TaxID=2767425 RepID=A0A8J6PLD6_9HYPH|nr:LacI family DNA-binding transcriptional regulator [Oryzicola mucosus]MBD0416764.1 LacI family DNA-binding transcriptional regulator [Oryzicola mucosus]
MKDVALTAGVHPATVSRFMNARNTAYVGAETAERITKAAEELGYKRNLQAAGLRGRRSHTIGILVTSISYPVFPPLIEVIQTVAKAAGYVCYIQSLSEDQGGVLEAVDNLLAHQVDGIILASSYDCTEAVAACAAACVPLVLIFNRDGGDDVLRVLGDDVEGTLAIVQHLVGLGHRRVAHISGPVGLGSSRVRKDSFAQALVGLGLAQPPEYFHSALSHTREEGRAAMAELIALPTPPTAVATASDFLALGCYDALREAGLSCPDDYSVVGFEDIAMCDLMTPPLTTVHTDLTAIGQKSAEVLLDAMSGRTQATPASVFLPALVLRGSTAPPRA